MVDKLAIKLLIVDNISTLTTGDKENEAESWIPLQHFALKAKRMGVAVLFIHHASKTGAQRGTSKREDVMDTVIQLSKPHGYDATDGAHFKLEYDKARHMRGEDAEGFEAKLLPCGNWEFKSLDDEQAEDVQEMLSSGLSVYTISADKLGPKERLDSSHRRAD